jgi:hypothetical protein
MFLILCVVYGLKKPAMFCFILFFWLKNLSCLRFKGCMPHNTYIKSNLYSLTITINKYSFFRFIDVFNKYYQLDILVIWSIWKLIFFCYEKIEFLYIIIVGTYLSWFSFYQNFILLFFVMNFTFSPKVFILFYIYTLILFNYYIASFKSHLSR